MTSREALAAGELVRALDLQEAIVNRSPDDPVARLFLFELCFLAGRRIDALEHLASIDTPDTTWPAARNGFNLLLEAEAQRFPKLRRPEFFLEPPRHLKRRWNAALCQQQGYFDRAMKWLDLADEDSPEVRGFLDGREFLGLRDSDERFASAFEVFHEDGYFWVPFDQVKRLQFDMAKHPLDVAFRPGLLTLSAGQEYPVTVPLLYPGSAEAGEEYALGQAVDWAGGDNGLVMGLGAKVLNCGEEEVSLAECKMFEFRE